MFFAKNRISHSPIFKNYYDQLASCSISPYLQIDKKKICEKAIEDILKLMGASLDWKGNLQLVPKGYIGRMINSDELKAKIIGILSEGIGLELSYSDLREKFYNAISTEKNKNEELETYLDCYAHDLFSAINQAYNSVQAECMGFNTFIYQGDIIGDSREFCKNHINGVFTREDIKLWKDQDWKGKNYDVPFEISRGGYNCRHTLMWIPDEAAQYFRDNQ